MCSTVIQERYIYHQLRPTKVFTRTDFMLLSGFVNNSAIKPGVPHTLFLQNTTSSFWKFISFLFNNTAYANLDKKVITEKVAINEKRQAINCSGIL